MSFSGVQDASQTAVTTAHGHHHGGHRKQVLDSVAKTLGVDDQDLQTELRSGKSLAQIADEKGVSRDDLTSAIEQGLSNGQTGGVDQSQLQQQAQRIADRVPGRRDDQHEAPAQQPTSPYSFDVTG